MTEKDYRVMMLESIIKTPHRKLGLLTSFHKEVMEKDPYFYSRLAVWYRKNGEVKDHQQLFIAHLFNSDNASHREAAAFLLMKLAPYQVNRVRKYMKTELGRWPRIFSTAVKEYLHQREKDDKWFDRSVLGSASDMKDLYRSLQIPFLTGVNGRADRILFKNDPPEDSLSYKLRELAKAKGEINKAKVIETHNIPYRNAVGAIDKITPFILRSLIKQMTPQQIFNNLKSLKDQGAMKDSICKERIDAALKEAKKSKKVHTLKANQTKDLDAETQKELDNISEARLQKQPITMSTLLLVDKSSSMSGAIEYGNKLSVAISSSIAPDTKFQVYAFDDKAFRINPSSTDLKGWRDAFSEIRASNMTACGAGLVAAANRGFKPEQIVVITDEGDNSSPLWDQGWLTITNHEEYRPKLVILFSGRSRNNAIRRVCDMRKVPYDYLDVNGVDNYSIPNVLRLLKGESISDLLQTILDLPLPRRKGR